MVNSYNSKKNYKNFKSHVFLHTFSNMMSNIDKKAIESKFSKEDKELYYINNNL